MVCIYFIFVQLKQDPSIQFATYNNINDLRANNVESVMMKGGQLIADDSTLFEITAGTRRRSPYSPLHPHPSGMGLQTHPTHPPWRAAWELVIRVTVFLSAYLAFCV